MSGALRDWLQAAVEQDASDLHLVDGHPPVLRVHGQLIPIAGAPVLSAAAVRDAVLPILPSAKISESFATQKHVDFCIEQSVDHGLRRFRANVFQHAQQVGACLRVIPAEIPSLKWAGFSEKLATRLTDNRNGLILVSGVTGSGKSTTLAMLVRMLSERGHMRIITIEEPVEYNFPSVSNSIITQREVGVDVDSFSDGLRSGLRQDPDVILVGEIRDRDAAQMALTAAETGHLVLSTVHARDAKGVISRFADLFPQEAQPEIRAQLAISLKAVLCQNLIPAARPGEKRKLALEILFNTSPMASAIRQGKLPSIDNNIQTGRSEGMVTMDDAVKALFQCGDIEREMAERFISDFRLL